MPVWCRWPVHRRRWGGRHPLSSSSLPIGHWNRWDMKQWTGRRTLRPWFKRNVNLMLLWKLKVPINQKTISNNLLVILFRRINSESRPPRQLSWNWINRKAVDKNIRIAYSWQLKMKKHVQIRGRAVSWNDSLNPSPRNHSISRIFFNKKIFKVLKVPMLSRTTWRIIIRIVSSRSISTSREVIKPTTF